MLWLTANWTVIKDVCLLLLLPLTVNLLTVLRANRKENRAFHARMKAMVQEDVPDLYLWVVNTDARLTDVENYLANSGFHPSVRSNILRALKGNGPTGL